MLAYRHAFHAGNHADVLKHLMLVLLMRHLNLKPRPYRVLDTHAGAGAYSLCSAEASKNAEFRQGIGRLWARDDLPEPVADYLRLVRQANPDGGLTQYPGSPLLASMLRREGDQLRLYELHPADHAALAALLGGGRGVEVHRADGFAAPSSQLPPPMRRALLLMDPSYEGQRDYTRVVESLREALRRFAPCMCMVWYPLVGKPGAEPMVARLKAIAPASWLHARLSVQDADAAGFGLRGSGVFVINPPHTLFATLQPLLPWLVAALGQHALAGHRLEQHAV